MAEKLEIKENVFFTIEDLNNFIEENKIKKSNIMSIENISKERLIDLGADLQKTYQYRLIWVKESDGVLNG